MSSVMCSVTLMAIASVMQSDGQSVMYLDYALAM
jgi:hypothetical protein